MGTDRPRLASEDRYAAIVELARIEHGLLDDGRLEELEALKGRWSELTDDLPSTPPARAREPLKRALAMHVRIGELLLARRAAIVAELAALARAGRAADGYARSAIPGASSVDHSA
jgi:hypothetical protein